MNYAVIQIDEKLDKYANAKLGICQWVLSRICTTCLVCALMNLRFSFPYPSVNT